MDFANYTQIIDRTLGSALGLGIEATDVLVALIIIAIFSVLSRVATFLLEEILPRLTAKTKTTLDDELLKALQKPIHLLVFLTGFAIAVHTLNIGPVYFDIFDKAVTISYILLSAYLLSNFIHALIKWYQNDIGPKTKSKLDDQLMPFLDKVDRIIIFSIAFLMILDRLGYPITPVLASMGVAGIAVAFAAQETLSNVFGAFSILTDQPFKVGDRIAMSDDDIGDVIDIGVRSTRLKTIDNKVVIYPNSVVSKGKIINYSEPDLKIRYAIPVSIGYKEDIERSQNFMVEIAKKTPGVLEDPAPQAYVVALSAYSIDLILHVWVTDYRLEFKVRDTIYREIITKFTEENINIPYPITTIIKGRA